MDGMENCKSKKKINDSGRMKKTISRRQLLISMASATATVGFEGCLGSWGLGGPVGGLGGSWGGVLGGVLGGLGGVLGSSIRRPLVKGAHCFSWPFFVVFSFFNACPRLAVTWIRVRLFVCAASYVLIRASHPSGSRRLGTVALAGDCPGP
jgi:hypothetical protein